MKGTVDILGVEQELQRRPGERSQARHCEAMTQSHQQQAGLIAQQISRCSVGVSTLRSSHETALVVEMM